MNQHVRPPAPDHPSARPTTRAAEGLQRWRWTTAELIRLTDLGAFRAEDKFELIGGEIVPMSPTGRWHEVLVEDLERALRDLETASERVVKEPQFNLDDDTYTEPDILVRPAHILTPDVRGDTALLVVEVADSSLDFDLTTKAAQYCSFGVREYWVVNVKTRETTVHRSPEPAGYADVVKLRKRTTLRPSLAPHLAVRLADLDRK